jgi:hypothetical protein
MKVMDLRRYRDGLQAGLLRNQVQFPTGTGDFSVLDSINTSYGAHPATYPMGIVCSFTRDKMAWV